MPSNARLISYGLFGLAIAGVTALRLGPALLAGLCSFMILDLSYKLLLRAKAPRLVAKWGALLLLLFALAAGTALLATFVRDTLAAVPQIAVAVVPGVIELFERYGVAVPFEDVLGLRDVLLKSFAENLGPVTRATGILTGDTLRIFLSIAVAVLYFLMARTPGREATFYGHLILEFAERMRRFMEGFEKVLGAQVVISSINTVLTAAYLLWAGLPHLKFLIPATFILGIVPIMGNIMSNVLIIGTALTVSPKLAALSLGFLVFIHTLEHFLNSRIVGGRIEAPMWLTLLSIMIGELVMGVSGIVLAPTLIHYMRQELRGFASESSA